MQDWVVTGKDTEKGVLRRKKTADFEEKIELIDSAHFAEFDIGLYIHK